MALIREIDYGTPKRIFATAVTLEVDGKSITVPTGTSVMRAAAEAGVQIPKLCASDNLEPFGSCRLCLVEIDGRKGTPASCTTPVEAGMKVRTQSPRLAKLRRGVMELYASDFPAEALNSSAGVTSEFQEMAVAVGLNEVRYGLWGRNHLKSEKDESNPYFAFDPAKCIVCSRCVRACDEVQGTLALTIDGRGFASQVSAGDKPFIESECVSCGACVQACPTGSLLEKSVIEKGAPDRSVVTTCAYCGVGCSFKAELQDDTVVRMMPFKEGKANHGHSCVKGRFAWGYATHKDRILKPMVRAKITDPWREVTWEEAINHASSELKRIQAKYGRDSIGGITSSRCTNEETYLVQKMIRAAFGNNNTDTCARVCHSPTGYGLKTTLGTSAGTQDFDSVEAADVIMIIGANPTDAHPVFASQMKRRLREGARLIIVDPRRIDLVKSPHIKADYHLPLLPGTNVAVINALAHVVVTEGLVDEAYVKERCETEAFEQWRKFVAETRNSPEALEHITGVPAADIRGAARLYATGGNGAIYYGLGVTEHSQGSTMVMGMANLAMATGNFGKNGVGVNPLRGQNNVQGSCDMGSFPHEFPGYRHVSDNSVRQAFEKEWKVPLQSEPGLRIPNMIDAALDGTFKGLYVQGEDIVQSDPGTQHISAGLGGDGVRGRPGSLPERNGELRARISAGIVVPRKGRHIHKRGAAHQPRAKGRSSDGRIGGLGSHRCALECARIPDALQPSVRNHGRDRAAHSDLRGRQLREDRPARQPAVAVQRQGSGRDAGDARGRLRARQGQVHDHRVHPHRRAHHGTFPVDPYDRAHPLAVQRRRADPAHGEQRVARHGCARDSSVRR